ncbi:hypothetical protein ALP71_05768 [Pseudomonas coronafaciens pv. garcae]|nr:hypothetical protein ALP71_05768 [Pseudomonas coronafaciens pv. garcae]
MQVFFDRVAQVFHAYPVLTVAERSLQVGTDTVHRQQHAADYRGDRRREPAQSRYHAQRHDDAEQGAEQLREIDVRIGQRRIGDAFHPALAVGQLDHGRLQPGQADAVYASGSELLRDDRCGAIENVIGKVIALRGLVNFLPRQQTVEFRRADIAFQVRAQCAQVSYVTLEQGGLDRVVAVFTFSVDQCQHLAAKAARTVDHRAPQGARFPPAIVGTGIAKADQHDERRAEQGEWHQRKIDTGAFYQHDVYGHGHVPEQKPEQRPANVSYRSCDAQPFFFVRTRHCGTPLLVGRGCVRSMNTPRRKLTHSALKFA